MEGAADLVARIQADLKEGFKSGFTKKYNNRIQLLKDLKRSFIAHKPDIIESLDKDLSRCAHLSILTEYDILINNIDYHIQMLSKWMQPEPCDLPLLLAPAQALIVKEPYGLVLVIGAWNFPFATSLNPVITAIAAGNCVLLKPSEISSNTSRVMKSIISNLNQSCIQCIEGGTDVAVALTQARWDLIGFTGSPEKGKLVAQAAAKFLTPTLLELGGKNPVIIDENVDLSMAVQRIAQGRFLNSGQICLSPEIAFVHSSNLEKFLQLMKETITQFYGANPKESKDYGRIINEFHTKRVQALVRGEHNGNIVIGGEIDIEDKYIAPTVIVNPSVDSEIAKEEIFGPVLLVYSFEKIQETIDFINAREKPLALYYYGKSKSNMLNIRDQTSSGNFCWNESVFNYACITMPFGGVGNSGNGVMYGKEGFKAMSHQKSVLLKDSYDGFPVTLRYPPYTPSKIKRFGLLKQAMSSTLNSALFTIKFAAIVSLGAYAYKLGYLDSIISQLDGFRSTLTAGWESILKG